MMLTSVDDLEAALDRGELEARWLLHPGSWFELLEVARRCGDAGARLELSIRDGDDAVPMAALPIAEFTAAYETIRDWWPQLSGESRPRSLGPDAYNQLAGALCAALAATADRRLAGSDRGDARLGFPPLG
ncbi:MAG: hypothetical protein KDE27_32055, partial [Planctomycetes bacterium]|nr:hypothetical protein [Planctomycetota bacterium]